MNKSQMEMYGKWLLVGGGVLFALDMFTPVKTGNYGKLAAVAGIGLIGLGMVM